MHFRILRSKSLNNIPERKISEALENTIKGCEECSANEAKLDSACKRCRYINSAIKRYAESNVPVRYWDLSMKKHFVGDKSLLDKFNKIADDLEDSYKNGVCICFAGNHGTGKTFITTNILKKAAEKGFNCLYTTLDDIVSNVLSSKSDDKVIARQELTVVDFLVIDEFDSRYISSDSAADLYGKILENVFRTRYQNKLPTFMCTNSPNVVETFRGPIKDSISSLMSYVEMFPVLGRDFRKMNKVNNG